MFHKIVCTLVIWITTAGAQVWTGSLSFQTAPNTISDLACDKNGKLWYAGYFQDSLTFPDSVVISNGNYDCFIASADSLSRLSGIHTFGGSGIDCIYGIDILKDGALTATGTFQNELLLDGKSFTAPASESFFLIMLNPDATLRSAIVSDAVCGKALAANSTGLTVVTGQYATQTITPSNDTLIGKGGTDIFCTLFDAAGNARWSRNFTSRQEDIANTVIFSGDNRICLLGTFGDTLYMDGDTIPTEGWAPQLFLAAFDTLGTLLWKKKISSETGVFSTALTSDAAGNIFCTGSFKGDISIDTITVEGWNEYDFFLARITPEGGTEWIVHTELANGDDIVHGPDSTLFISGSFRQHTTFGEFSADAHDIEDIFIGVFNYDGVCTALLTAGGCRSSNARHLTANDHNLFIAGYMDKSGCIHDCAIEFGTTQEVFLIDEASPGNTYLATIDYTIEPERVMRPLLRSQINSTFSRSAVVFDLKGRSIGSVSLTTHKNVTSRRKNIASQLIVGGVPGEDAGRRMREVFVR